MKSDPKGSLTKKKISWSGTGEAPSQRHPLEASLEDEKRWALRVANDLKDKVLIETIETIKHR